MPENMDTFARCWRLELFFKSAEELKSKALPFLKEQQFSRVNITNKTKDDNLLQSTAMIAQAIPHANVCVHYSLKWNYNGGQDQAFQHLQEFLQALGQQKCMTSVLLVSGGGKKKRLDTVQALKRFKGEPPVPIHVAFNPYFPGAADVKLERDRMEEKLASGWVSGIWLQTGSDLAKLESGLKFLKGQTASRDLTIYGSIFLPNKQLLAQMKYRPWNGVFLSDEYLSSVEAATKLTKGLLSVYEEYSVVPLLETALRTGTDVQSAYSLLGIK